MNEQCKTCKFYANSNADMRNDQKVIVGNYCLKFKWNLSRSKTWEQKLSNEKVTKFSEMKKIQGNCYERKWNKNR